MKWDERDWTRGHSSPPSCALLCWKCVWKSFYRILSTCPLRGTSNIALHSWSDGLLGASLPVSSRHDEYCAYTCLNHCFRSKSVRSIQMSLSSLSSNCRWTGRTTAVNIVVSYALCMIPPSCYRIVDLYHNIVMDASLCPWTPHPKWCQRKLMGYDWVVTESPSTVMALNWAPYWPRWSRVVWKRQRRAQ